MRIISGTNKSRIITPPSYFEARPTTDRAKEGLFNILDNNLYINKIRALDLFAGTGSISYELASRGCNDITTVELNRKYADFIKKTAEQLHFNQIITLNTDAFKYLEKSSVKFDLIFADPPYDMKGIEKIPELVFENQLLRKGGWLVLEHSPEVSFAGKDNLLKVRNYGKVYFSIFELTDEEQTILSQ